MGFLKDIQNLFPWTRDFRERYNASSTITQDPTRSSTGWLFYKYLPYAASWVDEQPQDWIIKKGDWDVPHGSPLIWVNRATGETRRPQEKTTIIESGGSFLAAGRQYANVQDLVICRKENDPTTYWVLDCYGRKVFYISERYPVFDSYDRLTEDRLFRWMYLCEDGALTCVYLAQDNKLDPRIIITEDVASLDYSTWEAMEAANYLECR